VAVLVDTKVICDVLYNDPVWSDWSSAQIANHWGQLCINPIIYAELSYQATSPADVNDLVEHLLHKAYNVLRNKKS
jgi:predicted nucleic acid-binding protein